MTDLDLTKWPTVNTALGFFFNGIPFLLPKKNRVNISPGLSWHDSHLLVWRYLSIFVCIPIDQYHFGCGLSFSHPRCSRQDLCLFKGTHFGHHLQKTCWEISGELSWIIYICACQWGYTVYILYPANGPSDYPFCWGRVRPWSRL